MIECDCDCGNWCVKRACFRIVRKGKEKNVCSHCRLTEDKTIARLYEQKDIPALIELDQQMTGALPATLTLNSLMDSLGGIGLIFQVHLKNLPLWKPQDKAN